MIKTVILELTEESVEFLQKLCDYTRLSMSALITGILWDMILKEEDEKKAKRKKRPAKNAKD